jgi:hypothetical protein
MLTSAHLKIDKLNVAAEPRKGTRVESTIPLAVVAAIVAYWRRFLNEVDDGCI